MRPGPTLAIVGVKDSETLHLENGTVVRLVGALAPRRPLRAFRQQRTETLASAASQHGAWPLAKLADDALTAIALGRSATLWSGDTQPRDGKSTKKKTGYQRSLANGRLSLADFPRDRYGRVLAHVTVAPTAAQGEPAAGAIWLQAALLRAGLARAYSATDARSCVSQLLKHESVARQRNKPLWRHASYAVRQATRPKVLTSYMHSFQVVEGRVRKVARYRNTTYVNFGTHWRTDFTLIVEGRTQRFLKSRGLNVHDLEGHLVRVRGWIEARDGPMMRLTHAEQLERLDPNAAPSTLYGSGALAAFDQLRSGNATGDEVTPAGPSAATTQGTGPDAQRPSKRIRKRPARKKRVPPRARRARTNAVRPKAPKAPLMLSM